MPDPTDKQREAWSDFDAKAIWLAATRATAERAAEICEQQIDFMEASPSAKACATAIRAEFGLEEGQP